MALENKFDVSEEIITLSMRICPAFPGAVLKQVLGWDVRLLLWIGKMCSTGYFIHRKMRRTHLCERVEE